MDIQQRPVGGPVGAESATPQGRAAPPSGGGQVDSLLGLAGLAAVSGGVADPINDKEASGGDEIGSSGLQEPDFEKGFGSDIEGLSDKLESQFPREFELDMLEVLEMLHEMGVEMQERERDNRMDSFKAKIEILEAKIENMEEAAELTFAAGIAGGIAQIAGGIASMAGGAAAGDAASAEAAQAMIGKGNALSQMIGGLGGMVSSSLEHAAKQKDIDNKSLEADEKRAELEQQMAEEIKSKMEELMSSVRKTLDAVRQAESGAFAAARSV